MTKQEVIDKILNAEKMLIMPVFRNTTYTTDNVMGLLTAIARDVAKIDSLNDSQNNMSKLIKVPAENCLPCEFYDTCFVDGVGADIDEPCTKGYVWKLKH